MGRHVCLGRSQVSARARFVQGTGVAGGHTSLHQLHRLAAVLDHGAGQAQLLARSIEREPDLRDLSPHGQAHGGGVSLGSAGARIGRTRRVADPAEQVDLPAERCACRRSVAAAVFAADPGRLGAAELLRKRAQPYSAAGGQLRTRPVRHGPRALDPLGSLQEVQIGLQPALDQGLEHRVAERDPGLRLRGQPRCQALPLGKRGRQFRRSRALDRARCTGRQQRCQRHRSQSHFHHVDLLIAPPPGPPRAGRCAAAAARRTRG